MKKTLSCLLVLLILIFSLTSCAETPTGETSSTETEITIEPQTTLSIDEQKKIDNLAYIKQQLQNVVTDIGFIVYAYYSEKDPEKIRINISPNANFNYDDSLIALSNCIEALKNALNDTNRNLESFEYYYFTRNAIIGFFKIESIIRKLTWTSPDLENGTLKIELRESNEIIEQSCTLDEFMNFKAKEFTTAADESRNSTTA